MKINTIYRLTQNNGGYFRVDGIEYKLKISNDLKKLYSRLVDEDHSEEPNEGWDLVFTTRED